MALIVQKSTSGQFDIFKKDADGKPTGESLFSFASELEAHAKCYAEDSSYFYVPWDVQTLAGAFEAAEMQAHAKQMNRVWSAFKQVMDNILYDSKLEKKGPAIKKLTNELVEHLDQTDTKKTTTIGTTGSTMTDTIVLHGSETAEDPKAIKSIAADRIGAYAVLWGSEAKKDLDGEFFTAKTEELTKIFDAMGKLPLLYQHTADEVLKTHVLGVVDTLKADSVGLWYEAQLLMSSEYDEWVKKLIASGKLKTSSQTFPAAKRVEKTGEITRWPIIEITATPTPAEYRMPPLEIIKSAYEKMGCNDLECVLSQYAEADDQGAVKARLLLNLAKLQLELVD